jgi:excisionase family DNA binding protein
LLATTTAWKVSMAKHPEKKPDRQITSGLKPDDDRFSHARTPPASAGQSPSSNPGRQEGKAQPPLEPPLTIAEVARHYRVSERTVRRRIKDGTLQKDLGQGRLVRISVEQLRKLGEKDK